MGPIFCGIFFVKTDLHIILQVWFENPSNWKFVPWSNRRSPKIIIRAQKNINQPKKDFCLIKNKDLFSYAENVSKDGPVMFYKILQPHLSQMVSVRFIT